MQIAHQMHVSVFRVLELTRVLVHVEEELRFRDKELDECAVQVFCLNGLQLWQNTTCP